MSGGRRTIIGTAGSGTYATPRFDIRTWAHRDGRFLTDGAMANNSSTLTSATAAFTSADVGKLIAVATQPGSGTAKSLAGTISAVNSATSVTVSGFTNTTGGAISGAFVAVGSDETSAFQSAINAMTANNTGGTCYVPDGIYLLAGTLSGGAQLTVPTVVTTGQPLTIGFVGQTAPQQVRWNIGASPPSMSGPVILSLMTALSGCLDGFILNTVAGQQSNVLLNLHKLAFRLLPGVTYGSGSPSGLDLTYINDCHVQDVTIEVQSSVGTLPTPNGFPIGLRMPGGNNGAFCVAERVGVVGMGVGFVFSEHSSVNDLSVYACATGYKTYSMNHAARAGRLAAYWTQYAIQPDAGSGGKQFLVCQQLDIEDGPASKFYSMSAHIYDPSNLLYGSILVHRVVSGVGPNDATLVITGARNAQITPLMQVSAPDPLGFPTNIPMAGLNSWTNQSLNGRKYLSRVMGSGYISKIRLKVGTSSGNICVGVYQGNTSGIANAQPGALKATSGSVACPATGIQEVALTTAVWVNQGDWLAIMADNSTATFATSGDGNLGSMQQGLAGFDSTTGTTLPLPATVTIGTWENKVYAMSGVT